MSSRINTFAVSLVVHAVLLGVLLIVPLVFTETIKPKYDVVAEVVLIAPSMLKPVDIPTPSEPLVAPKVRVPAPARTETPRPELPKREAINLPKVELPKPKPPEPVKSAGFDRPEAPAPAPKPKAAVRTGTFSDSVADAGELGLRTRAVQTGGFGDPNGVTANGRPDKIANIASLGAFDLPAGGEGGGGGRSRNTGRAVVQTTGFSNLNAGGSGTGSVSRNDPGPIETPVEILSKPRPEYTEEARQLRLEGEVLIRVLFRATGEVRIIEIVRSLGHGLDQNAIRAAQQIRFKPASRQNQPVDSTAIVHIVFQLAY